ncbi:hypothetical protein [Lutibacter flavus]|uniref:Uncharacterized protein n=1 Tax=Lutibacter flavus TaxID=691689 RepID=A0A238YF65_9FLAO|nr:hypothetical protein [Lutibacter flavus]SNR69233.1 hypothetical protein SAMN04488111_2505 [Lutibacter flavus]
MQKNNHIKAFFFLGIFSMLLLHQGLAHWHHEHDIERTSKIVAHSDAHNHHHDVPEKESHNNWFLDLFLEIHVHSVVANEILIINERSIKQLDVKKDISTYFSDYYSISFIDYDKVEKIKDYQPPNKYLNSYRSSLDSRGPPSLG